MHRHIVIKHSPIANQNNTKSLMPTPRKQLSEHTLIDMEIKLDIEHKMKEANNCYRKAINEYCAGIEVNLATHNCIKDVDNVIYWD